MIRRRFPELTVYLLLILCAFLILVPLLYTLFASFMNAKEFTSGKLLPSHFVLDNYKQALENIPILKFLLNSFIQSGLVTLGQLITSSLAAFAFVFVPFKGRNFFFLLFISTMMIPWEATIIPNFDTVQSLGWVNTYAGLTVPHFAGAMGIFLLRQYFLTLPKELYEAAQMDGCTRFHFFLKFALPLSRPMLTPLALFVYLNTWNMYLWPLLVTNNNSVRTVQIGLKMLQSQETSTSWPMVMAAVVLILLPTLVLLFFGQKQLQRGLTAGAFKG